MLAFMYRFHGHGSLRYVYKNGQAIRSRLMILKVTANPRRKNCRVSVVVSKKVHKSAVGRNRIRRRVYEIIRHELPRIHGAHDIVIIVTSAEVRTVPVDDLFQLVIGMLERAGLYKDAPKAGIIRPTGENQ